MRNYSNTARPTQLDDPIDGAVTTLDVLSGDGATYPSAPFAIQIRKADLSQPPEVLLVTAVAGDEFTVQRGFDGTSAQSWAAGDIVEHAVIAADLVAATAGGTIGEGRPATVAGIEVYSIPGFPITGRGTSNWDGVNQNQIFYSPMILHEPTRIDYLVCEVTGGTGGSNRVRMGLYHAGYDWQPGVLIEEGEVMADATGVKKVAVDEVLPPGRYLLAGNRNSGGISMRQWAIGVPWAPAGGDGSAPQWRRVAFSYAAMPDPGLAWTLYPSANNGVFVWVQVSQP